jgi:hypothetical protein
MNYCCVVIPGAEKGKRIGLVNYGETGYYLLNYDNYDTEQQCHEHVRLINESVGISAEVSQSALFASMWGWYCPAAKPATDFFKGRALATEKAKTV